MGDLDDELDAAAAALSVLPPAEFTAARTARAAEEGGVLAKRITALRKPTVAAWAVNLLVADGQLAEAVELSQALHEAQDDLDAPELAKLGRQRRALVAGLARRAAELAADAGTALSAAVMDDVEKTINAAIVDAPTGAAVLTGRLVKAVTADSDLAEAVAGSFDGAPARPAPSRDDLAERRARKAAEAEARESARAASEASRALARLDARLAKSRERSDHLHERMDDLRAELERMRADAERVDAELEELERERAAAAADAKAAEKAADRARVAAESMR
jgi:hypothetical protein